MIVKELIEELKKHNPNAEIRTIRTINSNEWDRTNSPNVETIKNSYGEWVFIN